MNGVFYVCCFGRLSFQTRFWNTVSLWCCGFKEVHQQMQRSLRVACDTWNEMFCYLHWLTEMVRNSMRLFYCSSIYSNAPARCPVFIFSAALCLFFWLSHFPMQSETTEGRRLRWKHAKSSMRMQSVCAICRLCTLVKHTKKWHVCKQTTGF